MNEGSSASWRARVGRVVAELLIIFVGVTAAFVLQGYQERNAAAERLSQAREGIITELSRYEIRNIEHADSIEANLGRWEAANRRGEQAVPGYYRIPGAPLPPTAAWEAAVSSGVASQFDPTLRLELGYFYTDFLGIHDNYVRYLEFIEREVLPRAEKGPPAFYDSAGRLRPEFIVEMRLLREFSGELRRLSGVAGSLRLRLEALRTTG